MVDYSTLSIVLTGIGIIVAIVYYSQVLRNANKTRELQLFMNIVQTRGTVEHQRIWAELYHADFTDYDDYMTKFDGSVNPEHAGKRASIWWIYNSTGYLLMDGHIPIDMVYKLMGISVVRMWRKWGDIIHEIREKEDMPNFHKGFEYLVNEILKHEKEHPELKT